MSFLNINCCIGESHNSIENVFKNNLKYENIDVSNFYFTNQGKIVAKIDKIKPNECYQIHLKVLGGKGGFGSMLRALGAQIEKTTNREACRDLSGRRMRDVNNEKKLREWASKAGYREKERELARKERREKIRAEGSKHHFEDQTYDQQKEKNSKDMDEALQEGLKGAKKRKSVCTGTDASKAKHWFGIDLKDSSSSSSEEFTLNMEQVLMIKGENLMKETANISEDMQNCTQTDNSMETEVNENLKLITKNETSQLNNSLNNIKSEIIKYNNDSLKDNKLLESNIQIVDHNIENSNNSKDTKEFTAINIEDESFNLNDYKTLEDLLTVHPDILKKALSQLGMKCGGTVIERATRLIQVRGLKPGDIPPELLSKQSNGIGIKGGKLAIKKKL